MVGRIFGILGAVVGLVVLAALFTFLFVAKKYRMPAASMEPTLHCARPQAECRGEQADRFLAFTFLGYGRGDLIAFQVPRAAEVRCTAGGTYVKRIVAVGGDTWSEKNGVVYVNGKKLAEPYVRKANRDLQSYPKRRIPPDRYFVLGDNRAASCDSRVWGALPKELVIAKVIGVYWPPGRIRFL